MTSGSNGSGCQVVLLLIIYLFNFLDRLMVMAMVSVMHVSVTWMVTLLSIIGYLSINLINRT